MPKRIDLIGQVFERLTVQRYAGHDKSPTKWAMWDCSCACGGAVRVRGIDLRRGNTKSCGCLKRDPMHNPNYRHGMSKKPEHEAWQQAKMRCTNPKNARYTTYGGAGVRMCDEWLKSFDLFYAHIGPRPSEGHSLDRIDPYGNYEPGNVRWATAVVQRHNRRDLIHQTRT